jgi:Holliday junction resolvasome RuvABC endonuclease subunit
VRWRFLPTKPLNEWPKRAESRLHNGVFYGSPEERINYIVYYVIASWVQVRPQLTIIEEYAFSRGQSQAHALGELGGVVKHYLYLGEAPFVSLSSTSNKLKATGYGKASKEAMIARAQEMWAGCPNIDDVADAFHLARYGLHHYDELVSAA